MKVLLHNFWIFALILTVNLSCSNNHKTDNPNSSSDDSKDQIENSSTSQSTNDTSTGDNDEDSKSNASNKVDDGTYSATVDYNNPSTGYSATYTLDVEVSDGQVVQINFPNDGYLDEDHITAADIDEDGIATVEGEDGKTYEVHIEK